jgi:7-cyano-7-deazaguanine synthase
MTSSAETALVLFSGGQDSTTCVVWALERFSTVETVGFDYGQCHASELAARPRILARLRDGLPHWRHSLAADHVLPLELLSAIGGSALIAGDENSSIATDFRGLPATFVPGRNVLFLAAAAALAYRRGIAHLVAGMCETDYSGYPDCREETIKAVGRALDLAMDTAFTVHTPLMQLDKKATWLLAETLGGRDLVDLIVEETVTCYQGDREHRHQWGYGCGVCAACRLRSRGYERYVGG